MPPDRPKGKPSDKPLSSGKQRRDAALEKFERERAELLLKARRIMLCYAIEHGRVNVDDVREFVEIPWHVNPTCLGGLARPFTGGRRILTAKPIPVHSRRPIAHGRKVTDYKLRNDAAARAWLRDHPLPAAKRKGAK